MSALCTDCSTSGEGLSRVAEAIKLGGNLRRVVDYSTGQVLLDRTPGAGERSRAGHGLVNSAITARGGAEVISSPGGLILDRPMDGGKPPESGGKRGKVTGFSNKSKRRLLKKMMRFDWADLISGKHSMMVKAVFLTLTYPAEFSEDWRDWKADLRALGERVRREHGSLVGLWKLEFQERGAPHFHVLLIFEHEIPIEFFKVWVSKAWYEVVGSGDKKHLRAGTNVRRVTGPVGRLMRYLSKYMAKSYQVSFPTGRVWGVWGNIPEGEVKVYQVDWVEFLRRVRKWGKKSPYLRGVKNAYGLIVFGLTDQILEGISVPPG